MTYSLKAFVLAAATLFGSGASFPSLAAPIATDDRSEAIGSDASAGTTGSLLTKELDRLQAQHFDPLATPGTPDYRQSAPAARNPLSQSVRSASDLFLWNFVALVRAQQVEHTFDLVDTNLTVLAPLQPAVVSPVPLPPAMWLFVVGALGLAGAQLRTDRRDESGARPKSTAASGMSGAALA